MTFTAVFTLVALSFVFLFLRAAGASIAPVTENRSTRLRWIMFVQQLMWIGAMSTVVLWYENDNGRNFMINFANTALTGYWLLMGTLMLAESPELSPRVQRTLPQTTFARMVLTWFNPGPGTGFMYALTSGVAGIVTMSLMLYSPSSSGGVFPVAYGLLMIGYLCMYLGATRLISIALCRRFGYLFVFPIAVLSALLILGCSVPSIVMLLTTGEPSQQYTSIEFSNWVWTLEQALDRSSLSDSTVMMAAVCGGALLMINLFFLFREFSYRRIAEPQRVRQDRDDAEHRQEQGDSDLQAS